MLMTWRTVIAVGLLPITLGACPSSRIEGRPSSPRTQTSTTPTQAPSAAFTLTPGPAPDCPKGSIDWGNSEHDTYLSESDSGKTLCLVETTRFGIDLDEAQHPFKELMLGNCRIGYVSNYGPGNQYPTGYQALSDLKPCTIRNRDWWVRLVPA